MGRLLVIVATLAADCLRLFAFWVTMLAKDTGRSPCASAPAAGPGDIAPWQPTVFQKITMLP